MAETTRSAAAAVLAPEFDNFLFAPIGEDRNGMLLSVVSALARLDVDPWQEAANLAQLPGTTATRRLASLIAALPDRPSAHLDPGTIAARLIELLPRRAKSAAPLATMSLGSRVRAEVRSQPLLYAMSILMLIALGGLGIAVSHRSAAPVDDAPAPASSTVIPRASSPPVGR